MDQTNSRPGSRGPRRVWNHNPAALTRLRHRLTHPRRCRGPRKPGARTEDGALHCPLSGAASRARPGAGAPPATEPPADRPRPGPSRKPPREGGHGVSFLTHLNTGTNGKGGAGQTEERRQVGEHTCSERDPQSPPVLSREFQKGPGTEPQVSGQRQDKVCPRGSWIPRSSPATRQPGDCPCPDQIRQKRLTF